MNVIIKYGSWSIAYASSTKQLLLIEKAALEHLLQVIVKVLGIVLRVFNIQVLPDIFVVVFVIIRLLDIFRIRTIRSRPEIINIIIHLISDRQWLPKRIIIEGGRKEITGSVVVLAGTHSKRIKVADVVTTIVVALVQEGIHGATIIVALVQEGIREAHWGSRKVCEIRKVNIRVLAQIVLVQLQVHHTLGSTTSTDCGRGRRWPSTTTAR